MKEKQVKMEWGESKREGERERARFKLIVGYRVWVRIENVLGWESDHWKDTWECLMNRTNKTSIKIWWEIFLLGGFLFLRISCALTFIPPTMMCHTTKMTFCQNFMSGFASPGFLSKDLTVWLDGARPTNTRISTSVLGKTPVKLWVLPQKYVCKYKQNSQNLVKFLF